MNTKSLMKLAARVEHDGAATYVRLSCYLAGPEFASGVGREPVPIEVYRKEVSAFRFNSDYREYFDGFEMTGAELVFSGAVSAINARKLVIRDRVSPGHTYAYRIGLENSENPPTGPVFVRVRDERVWWPYDKVKQRLSAMTQQYPLLASLETYGTTALGNDIPGIRVGNRDRCIALVGAIHAGESGPELLIPALERLLKEDKMLLERLGVALLPEVNIDERERTVRGEPEYLRTNARGIDLNRNFPASWDEVDESYGLISSDPDALTYRGTAPASESETRAVMNFISSHRPEAIFSTHCLAGICAPVFLTARHAANDAAYHALALRWLAPYTEGYYSDLSRPVALKYACSAGSLPLWAYEQWRIPSFDLEWDHDEATRPCLHDGTTPKMIAQCATRHYQGLRRLLEAAAPGGFVAPL